jgi:hypothetical protein
MASFNLRRFANPDVLRTIDERHLVALFAPWSAYLLRRGVQLGNGNRQRTPPEPVTHRGVRGVHAQPSSGIDYEQLAGVLVDPDDEMPADLVDSLYLVDEMATPEGMDELIESAGDTVKLDDSDEQTPADVATQIFLKARPLLERTHAEQFVGERKSFAYFLSKQEPKAKFTAPDTKKIEAIQRDLGLWFLKKKKGDQVRVFCYLRPDDVWFLIRHGEGFRREGAQRGGQSTCVFYRPEKHDVLVYNPAIGELRINAGSIGERELYRRTFGLHLFGDADHFPNGQTKYTLEPLRADGLAALACGDVDGIEWIHLVEIAYFWGGAQNEISIHKAGDFFAALIARGRKIQRAKIIGAKFRVKFTDSKTPRMVSIRPPNVARFTRDDDGQRIEEWLARRAFSSIARKADAEA